MITVFEIRYTLMVNLTLCCYLPDSHIIRDFLHYNLQHYSEWFVCEWSKKAAFSLMLFLDQSRTTNTVGTQTHGSDVKFSV